VFEKQKLPGELTNLVGVVEEKTRVGVYEKEEVEKTKLELQEV